jgi:hypothetical protein
MIKNDVSTSCARPTNGAVFVAASPAMSDAEKTFASVAFAAQPRRDMLEVTVKLARVTLNTRGAALADVLAAIGRQAGVKVVLRDALTTLVTATLVNVPLEEAFRRLGRWHSVVFIYARSTDSGNRPALSELWVSRPDPDVAGAHPRRSEPATPAEAGAKPKARPASVSRDERARPRRREGR